MSSGRLEKTTRSSPHLVAQHRPGSSRFGSEPPCVEDDVDIWRYAILELQDRNDDDDYIFCCFVFVSAQQTVVMNQSSFLTVLEAFKLP